MTNPDKRCGTCRFFSVDAQPIGRFGPFGPCSWAESRLDDFSEDPPLRVSATESACEEWEPKQ